LLPEFNLLNALLLSIYVFAFSIAYISIDTGTGALLLFGTVQLCMTGWGFHQGEKLTTTKSVGLVLAVTGIVILLFPGARTPPVTAASLMILSGAAWAIYCIRGKHVRQAAAATAGNFLIAAPLAAITMLLDKKFIYIDNLGFLLAVISGAVTSAFAYVLWYSILPSLTSTVASTVQLSVPCMAVLGGVLFMGETLDFHIITATVIILGGIGLTIRAEKLR
jgi:drug/metabolite transporter (DMT)-like permease